MGNEGPDMFGKKRRNEPTVVGLGSVLEGTLRVAAELQIDGKVIGSVFGASDVSVGPEGSVEGELHGDNVAIAGRVEGALAVRGHLQLVPGGVVSGDMRYGSIQIERGAEISGRSGKLEREPAGAGQGAAQAVPEAVERPSRPPEQHPGGSAAKPSGTEVGEQLEDANDSAVHGLQASCAQPAGESVAQPEQPMELAERSGGIAPAATGDSEPAAPGQARTPDGAPEGHDGKRAEPAQSTDPPRSDLSVH
ncbi:MAG: polymer-forming cytoskeletal protein [Proteobacteria bacterium]|nr:polymer-forming cytoskeletal protein [Pseudomonadota bacterium]